MLSLASLWVLLLLPLPFAVYFFIKPSKTMRLNENHAVVVPFYTQLTHLPSNTATPRTASYWRAMVMGLIWVLLVIAAAKPQWLGEPQAVSTSGRDLLLAVDISASMEQEDMEINRRSVSRLVAVKHVVSEFITQRKGDRIGLVLFGSQAYLQTPLTFDTASVMQFLQEAQLGFAGDNTAIGDAIGLSVKRLKDRQAVNNDTDLSDKVIILLTDGENTAGEVEPLQAAQLAAKINTKIYTVGIGAEKMVVRSFFGNRTVNPSAALDEDTLSSIANATGGQYFRARNTKELNSIYQELDKLEPIDQEKEWLRPVKSLFMWPLGAALLLCLLFMAPYLITCIRAYLNNKHTSNSSMSDGGKS
jgi:Ca-activated chloride channel family protein